MGSRLDADLAEVRALARTGACIDLALGDTTVVEQVRGQASRVGFESPVEAATQAIRHIDEIPARERGAGSPIPPYHAAAERTIADGALRAHITDQGVRELVFHREAPVAAGVTVNLEASVRVLHDGSVFLGRFGWPVVEADVPVYGFRGAPMGYLDEAIRGLRQGHPFDEIMLMIFAAGLGDSAMFPSDDPRRLELAELMPAHAGQLAGYVASAENYAESVQSGSVFGACLYRSAMETLFEWFLGGATFSFVDQEDLNDIDEELRDALPDSEPLPTPAIPAGIPAHHWWWNSAARL